MPHYPSPRLRNNTPLFLIALALSITLLSLAGCSTPDRTHQTLLEELNSLSTETAALREHVMMWLPAGDTAKVSLVTDFADNPDSIFITIATTFDADPGDVAVSLNNLKAYPIPHRLIGRTDWRQGLYPGVKSDSNGLNHRNVNHVAVQSSRGHLTCEATWMGQQHSTWTCTASQ